MEFFKTPKVVWRIQNEDGEGPYRAKSIDKLELGNWRIGKHDETDGHPSIVPMLLYLCDYVEFSADVYSYKCGFTSIDQLVEWFCVREIERLQNIGFYITRQVAIRGAFDNVQCLFCCE